jgi:hypothetical protein
VRIYKALVDAGVIPVEWFAKYQIEKAEEKFEEGTLTKTMQ